MSESVVVTVLGAKELEVKKFRKQSPYVDIRVGDQVQRTSVARHQDTEPDWNETFRFNHVPPGTKHAVFTVYAKRHITNDENLGRGSCPISQGDQPVAVPLVIDDGAIQGELLVFFGERAGQQTRGVPATAAGTGLSATGAEPAIHAGHQKAVVEPPGTLTGYAATGRETAVDTDVPLTGYTPGGAAQGNGKETLTGYEATGAVPADAENEVGLGGYNPTGAQVSVEGQQHTPMQPNCRDRCRPRTRDVQAGGFSATGDTGTTEEGYVDVPRPTGFTGFEGEGQAQQGSAGAHPRREGIANVRPFAGTEERYS